MEKTSEFLIYLMACSLQGTKPEEALLANIDMEALLRLAKAHSVSAMVCMALEQMGFSVLPSRTNFLFATKDGASMRELFLYLKQRHIYIRYFDLPRIDNYVRITIGTDAQMDAFLQGTEAFLRGE